MPATALEDMLEALSTRPLLVCDMWRQINPRPVVSDASTTGGGVCVARALAATRRVAALAEFTPNAFEEKGVIVVEPFGGVSGWRAAHVRLGVHVILSAYSDVDAAASRVHRKAYGGCIEWPDIRAVGRRNSRFCHELLQQSMPSRMELALPARSLAV